MIEEKRIIKVGGNMGKQIELAEKSPHIVVISQYFYPEQFRINDICTEWVNRGYEVTVVTGIPNYPQGKFFEGYSYKRQRRTIYHGVKIIRLPIVARGNSKIQLAINYASFVLSGWFWTHFTRVKADYVFTYELSPMTQALLGVWFSKRRKIPSYLYVTDLWPENVVAITGLKNSIMIKWIQKMTDFIYEKNHLIFTSSRSFIKKIHQRNIDERKLVFWPQYAEDFYQPVSYREGLLKENTFNITFAGNIGEAQGLDILIHTALRLKRESVKVCFNIIGDGRYKRQLVKEADKNELKEYFNFIDKKPPAQIPEYLAASDALLICLARSPVFAITIPAKTQSCLACGKPILVSADGEVQEIIKQAQCGLCSDAGDSITLCENIIKMLHMQLEERAFLGNNALSYSEQFFNKEKLLAQMDQFFRRK